jgi:uridine kinase
VVEQYLTTVRPMHMQFVEPSKRLADVIIPEGGHNLVGIDLISGRIRERLANERMHKADAATTSALSAKGEHGG